MFGTDNLGTYNKKLNFQSQYFFSIWFNLFQFSCTNIDR